MAPPMLMRLAALDAPSPASTSQGGVTSSAGIPPTPAAASAELNRLIGLTHPIAPACLNGGQELGEDVVHAAMKLITLHSGGRFMALNPALATSTTTSDFSRGILAVHSVGQPMTIFCPMRAARTMRWILAVVESTSTETRLIDIIDTMGKPMLYLNQITAHVNRLGLPALSSTGVLNLRASSTSHQCQPNGSGAYIIAWAAFLASGRLPTTHLSDRLGCAMWLRAINWMLSPDDEGPEKIVVSGITGSLEIQNVLKTMGQLDQLKLLQALGGIRIDSIHAAEIMDSLSNMAEETMKQYSVVMNNVGEVKAMRQWFELGETLGYTGPTLKGAFEMTVENKVKIAQNSSPEPEAANPLRVFALVDGAKRLRYVRSKIRAEIEKVDGAVKWYWDEVEKKKARQITAS
ncbi:hypothetical protein QBC34DRAFT_495595 [Podospora aff. communis PSN243]|uniref:Uncharacterized protein n=1 Tax=Podospora aff. communis PSN243 TaxID=3040156 RepID=A0AAV9GJD1_9PEZI|nr:hypothetical protein QBC34DRAFT_495595 [Podospora aff. communis PSN243]